MWRVRWQVKLGRIRLNLSAMWVYNEPLSSSYVSPPYVTMVLTGVALLPSCPQQIDVHKYCANPPVFTSRLQGGRYDSQSQWQSDVFPFRRAADWLIDPSFFPVRLMPADPSNFVRHPRLAGQEVSQCVGFGEQEGQAKKTTVDGLLENQPFWSQLRWFC